MNSNRIRQLKYNQIQIDLLLGMYRKKYCIEKVLREINSKAYQLIASIADKSIVIFK